MSEYGVFAANLFGRQQSRRREPEIPRPSPEEVLAAWAKEAAANAERAARAREAAEKAEREARIREAEEKARKQEAVAKAAVAALTEAGYQVSVTEVDEPGGKRIVISSEAPHSAGRVSTNVLANSHVEFDFHAFPGGSCKAAREDVFGRMARFGVELTPLSLQPRDEVPTPVAVSRVRRKH
jgi:hypothetical protein